MPDTPNPAEDGAVEALAKAMVGVPIPMAWGLALVSGQVQPPIPTTLLTLSNDQRKMFAQGMAHLLHAAGYVVVPREATEHRQWRHVKRGTVYAEIGRAELQSVREHLVEGSTLVVYRGADGKLWARQEDEFEDGRFVEINTKDRPHD